MIETRSLTKLYDYEHGVKDITLSVEDGMSLGLLGRNGAGKTTFLRTLLGLLRPDSGTAVVNGIDIASNPDAMREITGYLPELFGLYNELTVYEVLNYTAKLHRIDGAERTARIKKLLERLDLTDIRDKRTSTLSKGLSQKVGFARALINDPQVIFLDEPTSGLDPVAARGIENMIVDLKRERKTLLITSHILPEAEKMCDSIALIKSGRLVASGSIEDVKHRYCAPSILFRLKDEKAVAQAIRVLEEEAIGRLENRGNELIIYRNDCDNWTPIMINKLTKSEIPIFEVKIIEPTLDDVYFKAMED